jgi:nucleotide-binding universal stress UspA family protein
MREIRRILVPVDFSVGSRAAVEFAGTMAGSFGASVDLFHVWGPSALLPDPLLVIVPHAQGDGLSLAELARSRADTEFKELRAILKQRGIDDVRVHVAVGDPAHEILALAAQESFDLIVMGTHGRTGLAHLLAGSVAQKVVQRSPCPVITVRQAPLREAVA